MSFLNELNLDIEKLEKLLEIGTYADLRVITGESNNIVQKDGIIEEISSGMASGVIIRVLEKNGWGFATSNNISINNIGELINKAYKMAKISNQHTDKEVTLKEVPIIQDKVKSGIKIHPEDISIGEKKEYLKSAHENMSGEKIVSTSVSYGDGEGHSLLLTSEGTRIENESIKTLIRMTAIAKDGNLQFAFDRVGGNGFEAVCDANIEGMARRTKERALRLLRAEACPKGNFNVILDPELAGVFIHEAVGHAAEADLILQNDSVFINQLENSVGSEFVTVIDDATIPNSFGQYKYDHEGVSGKKTVLIENGILKSYVHSRETAGRLNMETTGNSRSEGLSKPIVRMSNTYVKPGSWTFEELLEDTNSGIFLKGSRGGQVDTGKGLFQFNAVEAFLIENGQLTRPLRDAGLSGEILDILHHVDAVSDEFELSVGYCGKGGQSVPVGDGGGSIRTKTTLS
ncbi:peptidase U62 modulator of DNA gyrase [Methanococcus vannielii SB]|uniref:Peptidase U62 modulator of DNA gyrase n=1 Tax=Methanococcus vannielii (strain ATCC 35089 / DSM 1224 / JCM 13029 / OCM 148 / SB) TaxID=406327 RepID=A6UQD1_METVS|nr:TldD/PmbA family protein [Methanococcus vannielii]ABR54703.1 peptidase U62 modulator of DNA gyrase [Methanococcus vannielii SB]